MANIDKAFDVELLSLNDSILIASGNSNPSSGGFEAPRGSLYVQQLPGGGELFIKYGNLDTEWRQFTDDLARVSSNDTTSGYLLNKLVAGTNISLVENNDGGNETVTINGLDTGAFNGDLAAVTLGLVGSVTIPTSYSNISWPTTHVETAPSIVEHDNVNTDRTQIKETGLYFLGYSLSFDADPGEEQISSRVLINDTTEIPGSLRIASEDDEVNDLSNFIVAELTAGTYITLQHQASGGGNVLHSSSNLTVVRARGTKGDKGDPGSGTLVNVQQSGVVVPNTPHDTLNFNNMTASDGGAGTVAIEPIFGSGYMYVESDSVTTTTSTSYLEKLSVTTGTLLTGNYRIGWSYQWNHDNTGNDFMARIRVDDSTELMNHKQEPKDSAGSFSTTGTSQKYTSSGFKHLALSGVHKIDLDFRTDLAGDESSIWNARIELWRVS